MSSSLKKNGTKSFKQKITAHDVPAKVAGPLVNSSLLPKYTFIISRQNEIKKESSDMVVKSSIGTQMKAL